LISINWERVELENGMLKEDSVNLPVGRILQILSIRRKGNG